MHVFSLLRRLAPLVRTEHHFRRMWFCLATYAHAPKILVIDSSEVNKKREEDARPNQNDNHKGQGPNPL